MKFKAKIKYNFTQSREAKLFDDVRIIDQYIEFTFQDLLGKHVEFMGKKVFIPPLFAYRELVIPWLQNGNIPEIVENIS